MPSKDTHVNFDLISQIYQTEQKSPLLTKVPKGFYEELRGYLSRLKEALEESQEEASSKTMMLTDEYRRAITRTSQIYEIRERKITLLALSTVNGIEPETKLLVKEEKELFELLVNVLKENRERNLTGKKRAVSFTKKENVSETSNIASDQIEDYPPKPEKKTLCDAIESGEEVKEIPVFLILEDMPSFETEEGVFHLKKNDVISLPKQVAQILCQHEKARVIQDKFA
jgi:DNA replication initiation complex subunit (GINS family)